MEDTPRVGRKGDSPKSYVKVGGVGHFIPVMEETGTTYVTGDPLVGRREWPKDTIRQRLVFTGYFMEVRRVEKMTH